MGKNIVIFANITHKGKNIFLKRQISGKTYRFLQQEKRDMPIQDIFAIVLRKAYQENKKGYLSLSFVKDAIRPVPIKIRKKQKEKYPFTDSWDGG